MEGTQDDDELSFIHIAAATANLVRFLGLNEKKEEQAGRDGQPSDENEKKRKEHLRYVEKRLSDLRAFERRANKT
jgi:hypothetical protein